MSDEITTYLLERSAAPVPASEAISCYARGLCPGASAELPETIDWCLNIPGAGADVRDLRVPRRLRRLARQHPFDVRVDSAFDTVVAACAAQNRPHGWIDRHVRRMSNDLHALGYAHSVECWYDDRLVGGLFGLALGGLFIGESIFTRKSNAGSIATIHLFAWLRAGGFAFLDTQMPSRHMARYGVRALDSLEMRAQRRRASLHDAHFHAAEDIPEIALDDLLRASARTRPVEA